MPNLLLGILLVFCLGSSVLFFVAVLPDSSSFGARLQVTPPLGLGSDYSTVVLVLPSSLPIHAFSPITGTTSELVDRSRYPIRSNPLYSMMTLEATQITI